MMRAIPPLRYCPQCGKDLGVPEAASLVHCSTCNRELPSTELQMVPRSHRHLIPLWIAWAGFPILSGVGVRLLVALGMQPPPSVGAAILLGDTIGLYVWSALTLRFFRVERWQFRAFSWTVALWFLNLGLFVAFGLVAMIFMALF